MRLREIDQRMVIGQFAQESKTWPKVGAMELECGMNSHATALLRQDVGRCAPSENHFLTRRNSAPASTIKTCLKSITHRGLPTMISNKQARKCMSTQATYRN